jgi:LysR family hydrogen peroxide-inducible transcriptional activator
MAMVTLRQLRYFDAVARWRHFGKAAEAVAISQPALSMQIKELEEQLGMPLVERGTKGISLTVEGAEVANRAEAILASVRDLTDYARHRGAPLTGALRLGVIPSIAPYLLPRALPVLRERHPGLQLQLRETQTQYLIEELLRGDVDVLLLALPVEEPEIESLGLFEDRFLLAVPAAQKCGPNQKVTSELLAPERLLLLEEGHCLRDQALSYCKMVRSERLSTFGASSLATIMQLVANGHGITLLPEMCADLEIRDGRVALLRFPDPEPSREIGLAWRKSAARKQDFLALGELLVETMASVGHKP